jgi:hypothetical protein
MLAEAYDDELVEAYDDERFDDESIDDESSDDEAPSIARFRPRPRLRGIGRPSTGAQTGVDRLVVSTPRGPMNLQLPEKLVREDGLKAALAPIQAAINQHAARLNSTQSDLAGLSKRVTTSMNGVNRDIRRLKKAQSDSAMMSMLPLLLTGTGLGGGGGSSNTGTLLLVMMMTGMLGGGSGSGGDSNSSNNMMLPLLLLAM